MLFRFRNNVMKFLFTSSIKDEVYYQVVFLEQKSEIRMQNTRILLYFVSFIPRCISRERNSHINFQYIFIITNIKQLNLFTVNYPGNVPSKYIAYLMERLRSLIPLKHVKSISKKR
jgi:hypothetical protein